MRAWMLAISLPVCTAWLAGCASMPEDPVHEAATAGGMTPQQFVQQVQERRAREAQQAEPAKPSAVVAQAPKVETVPESEIIQTMTNERDLASTSVQVAAFPAEGDSSQVIQAVAETPANSTLPSPSDVNLVNATVPAATKPPAQALRNALPPAPAVTNPTSLLTPEPQAEALPATPAPVKTDAVSETPAIENETNQAPARMFRLPTFRPRPEQPQATLPANVEQPQPSQPAQPAGLVNQATMQQAAAPAVETNPFAARASQPPAAAHRTAMHASPQSQVRPVANTQATASIAQPAARPQPQSGIATASNNPFSTRPQPIPSAQPRGPLPMAPAGWSWSQQQMMRHQQRGNVCLGCAGGHAH